MSFSHLLSATAAAALLVGISAPQVCAQPKSEAAAAATTGKASTDAPANTSVQGTARAVKEGAAPVAAAAATAPAAAQASTAATASTPRVVPAGDLIETARASGQFSTFIKAVDATNLTSVLKKNPNLTVFAPTDAAFAALPPGELQRLMADKAAMQKLMTHHVINARVESSKIKGAKGPVTTVANDLVELDGSGDMLKADNATIVQADVMASNGVLHVVDQVLMPRSAGATASVTAPAPTTTAGAAAATTAGAPASATAATAPVAPTSAPASPAPPPK